MLFLAWSIVVIDCMPKYLVRCLQALNVQLIVNQRAHCALHQTKAIEEEVGKIKASNLPHGLPEQLTSRTIKVLQIAAMQPFAMHIRAHLRVCVFENLMLDKAYKTSGGHPVRELVMVVSQSHYY